MNKTQGRKTKVLTLSYDDGVVQDIRLIEIMNKYGLKGTFNINSGICLPEESVRDYGADRIVFGRGIINATIAARAFIDYTRG